MFCGAFGKQRELNTTLQRQQNESNLSVYTVFYFLSACNQDCNRMQLQGPCIIGEKGLKFSRNSNPSSLEKWSLNRFVHIGYKYLL